MRASPSTRSTPLRHLALRLWPAEDGGQDLAGEVEDIYSGECHPFQGPAALLRLLQSLNVPPHMEAAPQQIIGSQTPMAQPGLNPDA